MTWAPEKPKRRQDLECHEIDDELVLYDPRTDMAHALNRTASIVWELCDGTREMDEIARNLKEFYPEAEEKIPHDLARIVAEFRGKKLLE